MTKRLNIDEIEMYFETFGYPNEDIEIMQGMYVLCHNAEFFVTNILRLLREHPGDKKYMADYLRLEKYYKIVIVNKNKTIK